MTAKKKKSGARSKYVECITDEGLIKIEGWARDGLTDEQLAKNMGIGYSTLQTWKSKYQDIQDSLKRGKEVVDRQVENALLKRALGYQFDEVTREIVYDEIKQKDELTVTKSQSTKQQKSERSPLRYLIYKSVIRMVECFLIT